MCGRPTESLRAAQADLDDLLPELEEMDDGSVAAAHAFQMAVPLLAELDAGRRASYEDSILKAVPSLKGETLSRWVANYDRRHRNGRKDPSARLHLVCAADVEAVPVRWAWEGRVPLGGITVLVGDPGLGKTTLALELTAQLTRGQAHGDVADAPASVLIATAEDAQSVLRARLEAAGADLRRVHFVEVEKDGLDVGLTLPDHVALLEAKAVAVGARLVVVDPITGHLSGNVDSHKDAALRKALAPLARMADELDLAVLGIAHLNKTEATNLFRRVGGSIALTAAARSILLLAEERDGDALILVHGKCNLGPLATTQRLRIESQEVEGPQGPVPSSGIVWLGEAEGVTAADALSEVQSENSTKLGEAVSWLGRYFVEVDGMVDSRDVIRAAERDGIAKRTLQRARKSAGIDSCRRRAGKPGRLWWKIERASTPTLLAPGTLAPSVGSGEGLGTLAPSSKAGIPERPEPFEESTGGVDARRQDAESPASPDPDRFAGMHWREHQAARLKEIRERGQDEAGRVQ